MNEHKVAGFAHKDFFLNPCWRQLKRILKKHRAMLLNYPNVIGYGVGFKYIDDTLTSERCVTVLVKKKFSKASLIRHQEALIPKILFADKKEGAVTDIIESGNIRLYSAPGNSLRAKGKSDRGTIGIYGIDNETGRPVALTAMHVFPNVDEYPATNQPKDILFETSEGHVFGRLLKGTRNGIDAAKISLEPTQQPSRQIEGIGKIQYWRAIDLNSDTNTAVQMRGAASNSVNYGQITHPAIDIPELNLRQVIVVRIRALEGDSGAALLDHQRFLLGLLYGGDATQHFFSPISSVFLRLGCNLY